MNVSNIILPLLSADGEKNDKLIMEGTIVEKLECRPYADATYMNMKAKSIMKAAMPTRRVEQLDSVVTTFKPISDHKHNVRQCADFIWSCLIKFSILD